MKMRKLTKALSGTVAVLGMTLGLSVLAVAPAQAAKSNCPDGATCVWEDTNYNTDGLEGGLISFQQCVHDYSQLQYAGTNTWAGYIGWGAYNGHSTSVYNNGNYQATNLYSRPNYTTGGDTNGSFKLGIKYGDGDVTNSGGYVAGKKKPLSGRFDTVLTTCRN